MKPNKQYNKISKTTTKQLIRQLQTCSTTSAEVSPTVFDEVDKQMLVIPLPSVGILMLNEFTLLSNPSSKYTEIGMMPLLQMGHACFTYINVPSGQHSIVILVLCMYVLVRTLRTLCNDLLKISAKCVACQSLN